MEELNKMKKKILITLSFLVFILALQSVSTNAVRAKVTAWHPSIDEFFGQMYKGKQNNTWTVETLKPTSWEWPGSGGIIYRSDNMTSINKTTVAIGTVGNNGTGYAINDTVMVTPDPIFELNFRGFNATFIVDKITGTGTGPAYALSMVSGGDYASHYALDVYTDVPTTATKGTGTGLTLDFTFNNYTYTKADKAHNYNNHTIAQGDMILHNWTQTPNYYTDIGLAGPINYTGLDVLYGDVGSWTEMNRSADETCLDFLTVPMYFHKSVLHLGYSGQMYDAGLFALQAYWFMSYSLPDIYSVGAAHQYVWTYDNVNGTIWNSGEHGVKGTVIKGIITSNWVYGVEFAIFDVYYDAVTGILKELVYPSVGYTGGNIANKTNIELTWGLEEMHIVFDGDLDALYDMSWWGRDTPYVPPVVTSTVTETAMVTKTETTVKTETTTETKAPGFIALAAIFTMATLVIVIRRRRH
jgi:hypothetical protein